MNQIVIKEHTILESYLAGKPLTVIDLGACLGEFTNELENYYPIKKAILVEPNITNYDKIQPRQSYILLNKIASSTAGQVVTFVEDVDSPYNGSVVFNYFNNSKEYALETVSLESLIELMNSDDDIDILKIDIEGAEYDILLNASDNALLKFKQITVEFHDFVDGRFKSDNKAVETRLLSLGFSIIKKGTDYKEGSDYYDTLFYKA
jgi:FkbM family methyltransferase